MRSSLAASLLLLLLVAGCAAAGPAAPPPPASAAVPAATGDGTTQVWRGAIRCEPIPGLVSFRLNQPIEVAVTAGQAQYERAVKRGDSGGTTEYVERGSGPVASDGAVTLSGSVQAPSFSYAASYEGRLPPAGGRTRLTGVQHWRGNRINAVDRQCSMTLER